MLAPGELIDRLIIHPLKSSPDSDTWAERLEVVLPEWVHLRVLVGARLLQEIASTELLEDLHREAQKAPQTGGTHEEVRLKGGCSQMVSMGLLVFRNEFLQPSPGKPRFSRQRARQHELNHDGSTWIVDAYALEIGRVQRPAEVGLWTWESLAAAYENSPASSLEKMS